MIALYKDPQLAALPVERDTVVRTAFMNEFRLLQRAILSHLKTQKDGLGWSIPYVDLVERLGAAAEEKFPDDHQRVASHVMIVGGSLEPSALHYAPLLDFPPACSITAGLIHFADERGIEVPSGLAAYRAEQSSGDLAVPPRRNDMTAIIRDPGFDI